MLTWSEAHRIANIAAAQAHHDLAIDPTSPPIDVAAAVAVSEIPLMWRPMPRLFGAYLNSVGSRPGILVNSAIPIGARRHTTAHELGHHRLGHSPTIDDGAFLHIDTIETATVVPKPERPRWSAPEKTAEAFASWFLMPRRAVITAMEALGVGRVDTATQAYQLSLLLGSSYRSTVRHLPNLRLISQDQARAWMTEAPGRIKARLDPTRSRQGRGVSDIWVVDHHFDGMHIALQPGDQLVALRVEGEHLEISGMSCLAEVPAEEGSQAGICSSWLARSGPNRDGDTATLTAERKSDKASRSVTSHWSVTVSVEDQPEGLDRHWLNRTEQAR